MSNVSCHFVKPTSRFTAVLLLTMLLSSSHLLAADSPVWPYENETKEQRDARMQWWREARFGMFIHWGVYSVPAGTYKGVRINRIGEWIMNRGKIPVADYKAFAGQFNPVKYDAEAWVRLAKEAGMKYIVITSKHHDGFALFDSSVTDWDVVDATPYGKDLLKPLAEACRKYNLKLGFYYSQAQDWCHPGGAAARKLTKEGWDNPDADKIDAYTAEHGGHWDPAQEGDMDQYLRSIAVPQVREILSNYGDIAVLWWDTPTGMNPSRAAMFEPVVSRFPGLITNNRLGGGYSGDTETPEQHIPATGFGDRDWETCMTMNDTWGYKSYDQNWKPTETLLRNLIDIASKGGNYLLNVGPTAEGEIPAPSIDRLKEIGQWMKVNSESIYGTQASPFSKLPWGRCTRKETPEGMTTLYFHVFDWPADGNLLVGGLKSRIKQARLLAGNQTVDYQMTDKGLIVKLPSAAPDPIASVIVVQLDGPLNVAQTLPEPGVDGKIVLPAVLAGIHNRLGSDTRLETSKGAKNIGGWTNDQSWVEWEFRTNKPGRYEVTALVAAEQDSNIELQIGDEKLSAICPATGGYDVYRSEPMGTVELAQPGVLALQMRPSRGNWQPINLRLVKLVPVQ